MKIVSVEAHEGDGSIVHTIDVWFSEKRGAWIVERLDAEGNQIGAAHLCPDEADAAACVGEWLRAHGDIQIVAAFGAAIERAAVQRQTARHQGRPRQPRRRAA